MPNLLPEGYEDEIITTEDVESEKPVGYRNGLSFDYEAGDFCLDGRHKILDSDGIESWKSWCINCIHTERYKHLAYGTDFGIEWEAVFSANSHEEAESILIRQITEALLADPYERTEYVEDVEVKWTAPDAVTVKVVVHGMYDATIDFTAYITKGGV